MVGGGSIGLNEALEPEGGGGVTGIFSFYIYFRSLFAILKSIKCWTNPSKKAYLFSVRSQ